ncbi:hypothetical protein BDR05DRAFT_953779 [Suillus weaverae]|nr:hypothetical protein BDR05DRAFT_953779 [Suillus weaverae]
MSTLQLSKSIQVVETCVEMWELNHGKLLVDVGISFTPHSPEVPVVGVWRLGALEASFGAGGYKQSEMHHHNTLSRYGALQAEMQQERSQQTHITFRSTYNLYYESIRTNNNQVNFASDSDTYKLSPSYMAECFEIMKVVEGCKEKTYGVRDEYRVSRHAARIMLDNIEDKAIEYLHSDSILWIPSNIWFELIRRHMQEIQRTQITIIKKNPPNLGILTGLLNHMLRSTTTTPIVYDFHIHESLALLEYRNVLETTGMFFLQEFDLASNTCLEEVQQIDDVNVLALMSVNTKAQRDRAVERLSNTELSIGRLIVMFTRHMWLMLTNEVFKGIRPYPNSLQEAMKCWTITSIDDTLASVRFKACNTGITPGCMGPKSKTFVDRCSLFFPEPDAPHKDNDQWSTLWEGDGYITEFHRMMKMKNEDQQESLKQDSVGKGADLMDSQPFDTDGNLRRKTERQKRRQIHKKMTMAKRNKRAPPPPRPRKSRPFPMNIGDTAQRDECQAGARYKLIENGSIVFPAHVNCDMMVKLDLPKKSGCSWHFQTSGIDWEWFQSVSVCLVPPTKVDFYSLPMTCQDS